MNMYAMSMPANSNNINVVKKLAVEKDYTLKVLEEGYFELIDNQTGNYQLQKASLGEIYYFLTSTDD